MASAKKVDAWMPLWIGDYLSDTMGLTTAQHGCYLLLMMAYWRNKGPLQDDDESLANIARSNPADWVNLRRVMLRYFTESDGFWVHGRIDSELASSTSRAVKAGDKSIKGNVGKWGGDESAERGRELRSQRLSEARKKGTHTPIQWEALKAFHDASCCRCGSSDDIVKDHITPIYQGGSDGIENLQPLCRKCNASKGPEAVDHRRSGWHEVVGVRFDASEMPTHGGNKRHLNASPSPSPSPIPKADALGDAPRKRSTPTSTIAKPDDVDQQTWSDWLALRKAKRAPVTETVVNGARNESGEAGMTLDAFLQVWCVRGSQGLQADWLKPDERKTASRVQPASFSQQDALQKRRTWEQMTGRQWPGEGAPVDCIDADKTTLEIEQ